MTFETCVVENLAEIISIRKSSKYPGPGRSPSTGTGNPACTLHDRR